MDPLRTKIAENRFLVIGRAGMDFYPDPPGAKTEEAAKFVSALGGSSANIAVAITKHGGHTALITCVSDDAIGRYCRNQLKSYGVDASMVRTVGGEARNSLAIVESRVEDHQSVIYRNGAADFEMTEADVMAADYSAYGALITAGTVVAAEPSRGACFHAFDLARAAGLPIVFDIDYRPYSWPSEEVAAEVYSRAGRASDIVVGNDLEFDFMAGGKGKGLDFARDLGKKAGKIAVYKMGEKGAVTITADEEFRTGIYAVEALKPTGAGDGFMGGFMASMAKGLPLRECVLRGSAAAAMVVSKVGCAPAMPTTAELEAFLASHPGPA